MKKRTISAVLAFALLTALLLCGCSNRSASEMTVTVLSLGKADCSILRCGDKTLVIDCGEADDGKEIVSALRKLDVETVDCLIITHFDQDHIGGAEKLLSSIPVERVLEPAYDATMPEAKEYQSYRSALQEQGIQPEALAGDTEFTLGEMKLQILTTGNVVYNQDIDNNSSLVTIVEHSGNRYLFAGDVAKLRITELLKQLDGKFVFLKVPHHGQREKNSEELLTLVQPKIAVITCSEKNPADARIVSQLEQQDCKTLQTVNGAVTITDKGKEISVRQG